MPAHTFHAYNLQTFNFCSSRASAYTNAARLWTVFL